jgi:hypothetical protein
MSRRFKVWLDSGANHASCRNEEVSLDELGLSSDEWEALPASERDLLMREIAWDSSDWGYAEIESEGQTHEH